MKTLLFRILSFSLTARNLTANISYTLKCSPMTRVPLNTIPTLVQFHRIKTVDQTSTRALHHSHVDDNGTMARSRFDDTCSKVYLLTKQISCRSLGYWPARFIWAFFFEPLVVPALRKG